MKIIEYYKKLTEEQRQIAFKQMAEELEMSEMLRINDIEIYWCHTGTPLGEVE